VTTVNANPTMASSRPQRSRVERHVSFIGEFLSVRCEKKVQPQRTGGHLEEQALSD
jgi:hypothetical protein